MAIEGLKIIIAHGSDDTRQSLLDAVDDRHEVIAHTGTTAEMHALVVEKSPQLLVTGVHFPDGDGIDTAIELGEKNPLPAVIVTEERSLDMVQKAMYDHVMAYLIEPIVKDDLEAAIIVAWSRFQQLRDLEEQVGDLRTALKHRKVIERAKGILMATDSLSEAEAFGVLRRRAQDERRGMVEVAQDILDDA